jgi:hypothetical protein
LYRQDGSHPALVHTNKPLWIFEKSKTFKMPALPQFDYIFAIGTIFAFLDAWNIGMPSSILLSGVHDLV